MQIHSVVPLQICNCLLWFAFNDISERYWCVYHMSKSYVPIDQLDLVTGGSVQNIHPGVIWIETGEKLLHYWIEISSPTESLE